MLSSPERPPEAGFKAAVFQNERTGEFVLAFAGTELHNAEDVKADLNQGLGNPESQYRQATHLSVAVTDAVGTTTMVGHSLGGGLAATAAIASRSEAVTFNAAGLHANTIAYAQAGREPGVAPVPMYAATNMALHRFAEWRTHAETDSHITNYRVAGEPLTTLQGVAPIPEAQGKQIDVKAAPSTILADTPQLHYIVPVIDALRGREFSLANE